MPKYGEKGITAPSSSLVPHYTAHWALTSKREGCWLLERRGRQGREGGRREHAWHCVSHKGPAAASLALLGLMRGVVAASLNSCQTIPGKGVTGGSLSTDPLLAL